MREPYITYSKVGAIFVAIIALYGLFAFSVHAQLPAAPAFQWDGTEPDSANFSSDLQFVKSTLPITNIVTGISSSTVVTEVGAWLFSYGTSDVRWRVRDLSEVYLDCQTDLQPASSFGIAQGSFADRTNIANYTYVTLSVSGSECDNVQDWREFDLVDGSQVASAGYSSPSQADYPIRPFDIYTGGSSEGTASRILTPTEPELSSNFNSVVTASTTVDFSIPYVSNLPQPETLCVEIDNLSTYQQLIPLCHTVTQSGVLNFATSTTLVDGNQYRWRVTMWDANNTIIDQTSWYFFTVVTPPFTPYDPDTSGFPFGSLPAGTTSTSTLGDLTLECDPNDGFFSRSVCNLAVLLFVPSQDSLQQLDQSLSGLMEKQPFSAYSEFRTGWNNATQNPTVEYSSLTLTLYGSDVDLVSTTSLASVAGENSLATLRYLMAVALWIAFAWFCFIRVLKFF